MSCRLLAVAMAASAASITACSVYSPADLIGPGASVADGGSESGGRSSGGSGWGGRGGTPSAGGRVSGGSSSVSGGTPGTGGSAHGGSGASGARGGTGGTSSVQSGGASGNTGGIAAAGDDSGGESPGGSAPLGGRGGSSAGGASGGAATGGTAAVVPPEIIDDMEDGNQYILHSEGRTGLWYTAADDKGGSADPAPMSPITMEDLTPGEPGASADSTQAFHFVGKGGTLPGGWGAMAAIDLMLPNSGVKFPYDASKYKGIRFFAKAAAAVTISLRLPLTDTSAETENSRCASKCEDHWSRDVKLSTGWTCFSYAWPADFQQTGWGLAVPWDASQLVGIQFVVPAESSGEFWIDDISFVK